MMFISIIYKSIMNSTIYYRLYGIPVPSNPFTGEALNTVNNV